MLPELVNSEEGKAFVPTLRVSPTPDEGVTPTGTAGIATTGTPANTTPAALTDGGNGVPTGATTVDVTAVVAPAADVMIAGKRPFRLFFTSMMASMAKDGVHMQYLSLPQ